MDSRGDANGHVYRQNKWRFIHRAEPVCALCGGVVDKTLRFPHPDSPSLDHIIPIALGGSGRNVSNWQLAHLKCNLAKGDRLTLEDSSCANINHHSRNHTGDMRPCPKGHGWHGAVVIPEPVLSRRPRG
jgi:HNH endonuclease